MQSDDNIYDFVPFSFKCGSTKSEQITSFSIFLPDARAHTHPFTSAPVEVVGCVDWRRQKRPQLGRASTTDVDDNSSLVWLGWEAPVSTLHINLLLAPRFSPVFFCCFDLFGENQMKSNKSFFSWKTTFFLFLLAWCPGRLPACLLFQCTAADTIIGALCYRGAGDLSWPPSFYPTWCWLAFSFLLPPLLRTSCSLCLATQHRLQA